MANAIDILTEAELDAVTGGATNSACFTLHIYPVDIFVCLPPPPPPPPPSH
jgi:hypothetical protein